MATCAPIAKLVYLREEEAFASFARRQNLKLVLIKNSKQTIEEGVQELRPTLDPKPTRNPAKA
jgi:hypothetical protein